MSVSRAALSLESAEDLPFRLAPHPRAATNSMAAAPLPWERQSPWIPISPTTMTDALRLRSAMLFDPHHHASRLSSAGVGILSMGPGCGGVVCGEGIRKERTRDQGKGRFVTKGLLASVLLFLEPALGRPLSPAFPSIWTPPPRDGHHPLPSARRPPPPERKRKGVVNTIPPLPRLLHRYLAPLLARRHSPFHPWPPAADAFLSRGLASSSSGAAAAGREKSSRRTLGYLLGVAAASVGASYAAVPLYRPVSQSYDIGGTIRRHESVEEKISWHTREGTTPQR
nr:uncharacterized protein LOC127328271 [Lolium perenne]